MNKVGPKAVSYLTFMEDAKALVFYPDNTVSGTLGDKVLYAKRGLTRMFSLEEVLEAVALNNNCHEISTLDQRLSTDAFKAGEDADKSR
jgi:hypothetical protein